MIDITSYLKTRQKIKRKRAQLQEIADLCTNITVDMSEDRVQTSGDKDRLGSLIAKKVDIETELMGEISEALDDMKEIEDAINGLEDPDEQTVLQERFIEGKKWDDIADDICYSRMTAIRIKNRAISKIDTQ